MDLRILTAAALFSALALSGCTVPGLGADAQPEPTFEAHDHSHGDGHAGHVHDPYLVPAGEPTPRLEMEVRPDAKMGFNVHLMTEDFTFTPEDASTAPVPGEGHAHIYVDDIKLGRVYGPWYYLGGLEPGTHLVRVDLNTNDHRMYVVDDVAVQKTVRIEVPEPMAKGHSHEPREAPGPMSVALEVLDDPKSGYNLHIATTGFHWAPENASTGYVPGEGHAHLYVDGKKVTRLYGDWYHLPLPPGEHTVRVTLNGNDHMDYAVDGQVVAAQVERTV